MKTLETAIYTGYLWYSDQQEPEVYNDNTENAFVFDEQKNPFVVDGYLTDGKTSYAIKYISGKYHIKSYILEDLQGVQCDDVIVYTHRMKDVQKMKFRQYWRPVSDELCEGMKVLQPAELVFVGFEK